MLRGLSECTTQQTARSYEKLQDQNSSPSRVSDDDLSDVICFLTPSSPAALQAVQATQLHAPQHITGNHRFDDVAEGDGQSEAGLHQSQEFVLRTSSAVKDAAHGFRFGRNPTLCDMVSCSQGHDMLISNIHFRIFVHQQGSLMLEDLSTNGTIVDDSCLRAKDRRGLPCPTVPTRVLRTGTVILVRGSAPDCPAGLDIKLLVRLPDRKNCQDRYEQNLRQYLARRGQAAQFASAEVDTYGNHWHGGDMYRFTGFLGQGAFAKVYRVQTKNDGTMLAAKELDTRRFIKNGILNPRFDAELRIMKRLKHPNIVEYIDCQHHRHWTYIMMEYVPYGDLSTELQKYGLLVELQVQQIAKQVLEALSYLHRCRIAHRDIKPDNILIQSRDPLIVKLSDFGLSKCVADQESFFKTFCGTLLYCAPEVYPGYQNYTAGGGKRRRAGAPAIKTAPYHPSVDIWSVGTVLYHTLCGQTPYVSSGSSSGDRAGQMLADLMTKDVDVKPLERCRVSKEGIDLISISLNRDPSQRPTPIACLQHSWLSRVPEHFDYSRNASTSSNTPSPSLSAVEELDEDSSGEEHITDESRPALLPATSDQSPVHSRKKPCHWSNMSTALNNNASSSRRSVALFGQITLPTRISLDSLSNRLSAASDRRDGSVGGSAKSSRASETHIPPVASQAKTVHPLGRFGRLLPIAGSIGDNHVICLDSRLTSWGRGPTNKVRWSDAGDDRIPKYAIQMTFSAPGMMAYIKQGRRWQEMADIETFVSTLATRCIWINDIELRSQSGDGEATLYGKVYTGDIITIFNDPKSRSYLKYAVEITHGGSAQLRPADEPFKTKRETRHHR